MSVHNNGSILVNGCAGQILISPGDYIETGKTYEGIQFTNGNIPHNLLVATNAEPQIVHVTGSSINFFGHTLFCIDPSVGFVHAAAPGVSLIYYIPPQSFEEYCRQNKKNIKQLVPVQGWSAASAQGYLFTKMTQGFHWHIGKHDCAVFAQQLAQAGGVNGGAGSKSMFPRLAWNKNAKKLGLSVLHW
jgi:hypothetical protein